MSARQILNDAAAADAIVCLQICQYSQKCFPGRMPQEMDVVKNYFAINEMTCVYRGGN